MQLLKLHSIQIVNASLIVALILGTFTVSAQASQTAEDVLRHFYTNYLNFDLRKAQNAKAPQLQFSRAFLREKQKNAAFCRRVKDMPCGFGADGDPYLDAQDFGDELNAQTARLEIQNMGEVARDVLKVKVSFFLFPGSDTQRRVLVYKMKRESGTWRVDDIEYESGDTARAWMHQEIQEIRAIRN